MFWALEVTVDVGVDVLPLLMFVLVLGARVSSGGEWCGVGVVSAWWIGDMDRLTSVGFTSVPIAIPGGFPLWVGTAPSPRRVRSFC